MIRTALVLLLLSVLVWPALAQEDLHPAIMIPEIRHDFGDVFEMEKYEHTFVVRNTGKAELLIEDVKPG